MTLERGDVIEGAGRNEGNGRLAETDSRQRRKKLI